MNNIIPRAKQKYTPADFERMFNLCYTYKWLNDKSSEFCELWNMADNEEQLWLIELMLSKFTYVSLDDFDKEISRKIADQITNAWRLAPDNTIITAICDARDPDGSQVIVQTIKNKFPMSWGKDRIYANILEGVHQLANGMCIVLVDDFIGTGKTILRKIKYVQDYCAKNNIANISIKVVALAMMDFAKKAILDTGVDLYAYFNLKKGIDGIENKEDREDAAKAMQALEEKLSHPDRYRFGFENSQSLFALGSSNIPNNVFPIFWWPRTKDDTERGTIFRRQL